MPAVISRPAGVSGARAFTKKTIGEGRPANRSIAVPVSRLAFSERCHCHGLDMQQKTSVGVDIPQPYSRKGLRGWMTNVSTRFPYKERRVGKIMKIALTRLTSTPLSPTASTAEACHPLRVIRAACPRHSGKSVLGDGRGRGDRTPALISLYRKKTIKNSSSSLIGGVRKIRGAPPVPSIVPGMVIRPAERMPGTGHPPLPIERRQ